MESNKLTLHFKKTIRNSSSNMMKIEENKRNEKNDDNSEDGLGFSYWICILVFGFFIFNLAVNMQKSCDIGKDIFNIDSEKNEVKIEPVFNDTMARIHLKAISRLGRRPAGSIANEIHAPSYILKYLDEINHVNSKEPHHNILMEVDNQVANLNAFSITFFGKYHMTSIYNKIRNIVVRLHDNNNDLLDSYTNSNAILFNCHYDSFFIGPGASDDLVSCAVLLEVIKSIMDSQPVKLDHDLIFLFNGAEENMLQASHAFVSQHRWAKDVKLFVNLEAAGSGGRQMIFQTSKTNPWLIDLVKSVIHQPLATVIGQEIFSSNIIPSDTDFRIFRDFASLPGIDIAFISNGYVYHTRQDTENRIPQSCIVHTGENLLKLAITLANCPYVNEIQPEPPLDKVVASKEAVSNQIVYFDMLGLFLISYSETHGVIVNLTLCVISLVLIFCSNPLDKDLLRGMLVHCVWLICSVLLGLLLGWFVHTFAVKMTWYANRFHIVGLYLMPLLCFYFFFYFILMKKMVNYSAQSLENSSLLLLVLVTLYLTFSRLLSSYFLAIWITFILIHRAISYLIPRQSSVITFILDSCIYMVPLSYYFYMLFTLYDFFIPVLGRIGHTPADLIISCMTAIACFIPCIVFSRNIIVTNHNSIKTMLFFILNIAFSYWLIVNFTNYGFPYNSSDNAPRKQRIILSHVTRNIRNVDGQVELSESGIWISAMDANSVGLLRAQLEKVTRKKIQDVFCELRPYCGYPLILPYSRIVDNSLWLPTPPHSISIDQHSTQPKQSNSKISLSHGKQSPTILIQSQQAHISGMVNLTVELRGPPHTHLYMMTPCFIRVVGWSLGPQPPRPIFMGNNEHPSFHQYFIYNAYGERPNEGPGITLWLTFMSNSESLTADPSTTQKHIELALAANYPLADTAELESILHLIPNWVTPGTLAGTYEHIVVDLAKRVNYKQ